MTKVFNRYDNKERRKELRQTMTKGEIVLWNHLKHSQLGGFKFRRQHGIEDFVMDFYCPEVKLCVEVDGQTHQFEEIFERDEWRQKKIEEHGITVKRYTSDDVFNHLERTLEDLHQTCLELRERQSDSDARGGKPPPDPSLERRG